MPIVLSLRLCLIPSLIKIHAQTPFFHPRAGPSAAPRCRGYKGWTNDSDQLSGEGPVLLGQSLQHSFLPIRTGGAQGAHRGEDVSIEAFDGHWPAPISRVGEPRPWRSPGTSSGSPKGPLLAPLLLVLFLLPNPHQLHTSSLPADDHCEGMGREGSHRPTCLICTFPTWGLQVSRFPFPFLVFHLPDGTSIVLYLQRSLWKIPRCLGTPSPAVIPLPSPR